MFWGKSYDFELIPSLIGKTAIITGANAGIGKVCALEMARKGCHVIMASRSKEKSEEAIAEIKEATGNSKVEFIQLDLMSLKSVKSFVDAFKERYDKLDILINNAGIMMCPYALSEDGIETQFATNHVAHFYLTVQLLPIMKKSDVFRIVNVSSLAHKFFLGPLDLKNVNNEKTYGRLTNYGKSKASNIMFTRELARRLEKEGIKNGYVNANHPGVVQSGISRHVISMQSIWERMYHSFNISVENGALSQLYLATSPEVEEKDIRGQYYVPYGQPGYIIGIARSDAAAVELWEFTENLLKEKVPGYTGAGI
ncbi:hypothetical protein CLU79DRAFT_802831 [Phycomyces nitens]|nr:hypothetical protein CLU79DRAFT_802831 [Phycomyces nitens]